MSIDNNKNKVDLLGFQRSLNEQFLEIFEAKKAGRTLGSLGSSSNLGLLDTVGELNFFLPLKELKNISMTNTFEEMKLSKSWVCGFNQIRGEVFTILDLNKIIELFLTKTTDTDLRKMAGDNRIVYLKEYNESRIGLIINGLRLEYAAEYTPIIRLRNSAETFHWEFEEDIEFTSFVKESKMTKKQFDFITKFKTFADNKQVFNKEDIYADAKEFNKTDLLFSLVGDIYLDNMGNQPIFTLNTENLTKILINVSPF